MSLPPLIQALLSPDLWDHPTEGIRLLETHISWVILTGPFAYKIKKPVDFGFLDFSTLEKRQFYCHEELRLNRRLAPEIYLEVVAFTGATTKPRLRGPGPILDYAVKMRQFDQADLLAEYAMRNKLAEGHIVELARLIAQFHENTQRAGPDTSYGEPQVIQKAARENFDHIDSARLADHKLGIDLQALKGWTIQVYRNLAPLMTERRQKGFVRDCHGDLHLGNIVIWHDRPVPFDCIEFNPMLRWIDVISEIAFTVMDLAARGHRPFGFRFLNEYLSISGDYPGTRLLRYYLVYRAMVRAKITYLSFLQNQSVNQLQGLEQYLQLAHVFSSPRPPMLLITHGFSGSGKSHACHQLASRLDALHLRSDVERKRLAGLSRDARSRFGLGEDLYSESFTRRTYQRLLDLARKILQAEFTVIVDATFLRSKDRELFRNLAKSLEVTFRILDFRAEETVLRQRIENRMQQSQDPSDADLEVLDHQLRHHDPLTPEEQPLVISLDTSQGFELEKALTGLASQEGS